MPVRIASALWRICWTCARARSLVIQPVLSSGAAILPSSVSAAFSVTSGRPVRMAWTKASFSWAASSAILGRDLHRDAGVMQTAESLAGHQRIGIFHGRDHARDAGVHQGIGAGRGAALMGARLQRDVERRSARTLRRRLPAPGSRRASLARRCGIRARRSRRPCTSTAPTAGFGLMRPSPWRASVQRFLHPGVHFENRLHYANSDAMNLSGSKGSRSPACSPTPT